MRMQRWKGGRGVFFTLGRKKGHSLLHARTPNAPSSSFLLTSPVPPALSLEFNGDLQLIVVDNFSLRYSPPKTLLSHSARCACVGENELREEHDFHPKRSFADDTFIDDDIIIFRALY